MRNYEFISNKTKPWKSSAQKEKSTRRARTFTCQVMQCPKQPSQHFMLGVTGLFGYLESDRLCEKQGKSESPPLLDGEQCFTWTNNINQKDCNPTEENRKENGTKPRITWVCRVPSLAHFLRLLIGPANRTKQKWAPGGHCHTKQQCSVFSGCQQRVLTNLIQPKMLGKKEPL